MLVLLALVQVLCMVPVAAVIGFPDKFLVGAMNDCVVVTCDAAQEHVSWQLDGDPQIMAEHHVAGRNLTLTGLDLPATGNYSCWQGTRLLDSTYVVMLSDLHYPLLHGAPDHAVTCLVESYHGELTCSWTALRPAAFRARLSRSPDAPGDWFYVGRGAALQDPTWPQPFTVTLADRTFCPFAEELRPLELELEGISAENFVNITRRFFLRDIVRPGPPQDVAVHSKGGLLHLSWAPPASWSSPHSYFLLRYQLRYQHLDGTMSFRQLEGETETLLKVDVRRVQIRCQDPLCQLHLEPLDCLAEHHAVTCLVESYHGELTCSWTALRPAAFRARLSRSPDAPGDWFYVGRGAALQDPTWPQPFTVTLADRTFCPFAEELRPLELELEGISAENFVNITRRFFLRDIVRPGPPQDVAVHSKGGLLHLSWAPPASWSSPHSYFLLRYQLRYQHLDGTMSFRQLEGETETLLKVDVRRVQIRCQDPFVNSTWSPWTAWQNV